MRSSGSDAPVTLVLRSPRALHTLAREPNRHGVVRAREAGELDVDGDVEANGLARRVGGLRLTRGDRLAAAWAAWRVGARRAA